MLSRKFSQRIYNTCCGTLDLIHISQLISHQPFHPQILFPIFQKQKGIKVDSHGLGFEMKDLGLLHVMIVETQLRLMTNHFLKASLGSGIYRCGRP
jgi:hypothetical protein